MTQQKEYGNDSMRSLKGADRVRKRPAVIFGSDDLQGASHTFFEILSNSIDEARQGHGNVIEVTKHADASISIQDFARGLPMDWNEPEQKFNWELALCDMYAGGKYDNNEGGSDYDTSIGTNGLGLASSQMASEFMNVIVNRDKKQYIMRFEKGEPVGKLLKEKSNDAQTGTLITYKPDKEVFTEVDIPFTWICDKVKKQAIVNAGLKFILTDETGEGQVVEYLYEKLEDYFEEVNQGKELTSVHMLTGEGVGKDAEDRPDYKYSYTLGFNFNNEHSFAQYFHNSSDLTHGGSTADAIKNAFTYAIDKLLKDNKLYKAKEKKIKYEDIEDSLVVVINSFSTMTSYANQTKLAITNKFIKDFTSESLKKELEIYFIESPLEKDKILNQVLINKRSRESAETTRLNVKKKLTSKSNVLEKPDGFVDCKSKDKKLKELYIAEGNSALGAIVSGRNSDFQAVTHVRGKMLSCVKATVKKIFESAVITRTVQLLGCGIEVSGTKNKAMNTFDIETLQWDKIIIATDMDYDGFQIRCLIMAMIYRLMPQLIIQGKVYIVDSPLFEIVSGKELFYAYSEEEKESICEKLTKEGKKLKVSRNKGLGEVEPEVVAETMMNPKSRRLTQVTVENIAKMDEKFHLWMGDDASIRFDYLSAHFAEGMDY